MGDLGALFEQHVRALLRYCACRVGPDAAEDVVAETFLIAHAGRHRYDPALASPLTWLYGIATNVARRQRRTESRLLATYVRAATVDFVGEFTDDATARTDARSAGAPIARALARLPRRQRDVLLLFAVAELQYAEIAAALDIPIGSVQSSLHRARAKLRAALAAGPPSPLRRHPEVEA
jgi:RNA polymerase sigma factor (sigma-70 family)